MCLSTQDLLEIFLQRIKKNRLNRSWVLVIPVILATTFGLSRVNPVGGLVASACKLTVNKCFGVVSGDESLEAYLDFLKYYENETDFLPLVSIADNLRNAYLLSGNANQQKISKIGTRLIEEVLLKINYAPQPDEAHTKGTLRDQYVRLGVFLGSNKVAAFAEAEFQKLVRGGSVHPDIIKSIMQAGAFSGNADTFDWFIGRFENTVSEHDRTNVLSAMGCFQDHDILSAVCHFTLTKVPPRNQSIPIAVMSANPAATDGLWKWYISEKEAFAKFHPLIHERVFASIVPVCDTLKADDVRYFLSDNQVKINPGVVELTLERLEVNHRLRKKFGR